MGKCIESLLKGGEDVEILIVDDGSTKDNTAEIADEYAAKYPDIIKAIHKENGGHGSAVNAGIENASGLYFKVVDSDDWVQEEAYKKILDTLRDIAGGDKALDMLVSNFVYEKEGEKRKKIMHYRHILPTDRMFTWDDCRHFRKAHYILMHSVIFRTQLLKDCGLHLPEHTFYVDNIYVFEPLLHVNTMYYLDVNFYRYFIGRDDQSVNETNMIKRIDQQFKVTYIMIDYMTQFNLVSKPLERYMRHYLSIIMCISSVISVKSGQKEHLKMRKELWKYLYDSDKRLYRKIRHNITSCAVNLPGYVGRKATIAMYKAARRFIGFN